MNRNDVLNEWNRLYRGSNEFTIENDAADLVLEMARRGAQMPVPENLRRDITSTAERMGISYEAAIPYAYIEIILFNLGFHTEQLGSFVTKRQHVIDGLGQNAFFNSLFPPLYRPLMFSELEDMARSEVPGIDMPVSSAKYISRVVRDALNAATPQMREQARMHFQGTDLTPMEALKKYLGLLIIRRTMESYEPEDIAGEGRITLFRDDIIEALRHDPFFGRYISPRRESVNRIYDNIRSIMRTAKIRLNTLDPSTDLDTQGSKDAMVEAIDTLIAHLTVERNKLI